MVFYISGVFQKIIFFCSYYGEGYRHGQCGMTIQRPTSIDRSSWKCFIGYMEDNKLNTLGAILDATDFGENNG